MIKNNIYHKKDYFPCEGELVKILGVSRTTVRQAVLSLEVRGFLQRCPGKGLFIVDSTNEVMKRTFADMFQKEKDLLLDIFELSLELEPFFAKTAAKSASSEDILKMEEYVETMKSNRISEKEYQKADLGFHSLIAKASGNRIQHTLVDAYFPILQEESILMNKMSKDEANQFHQRILNAIKSKNGGSAFQYMKLHLRSMQYSLEICS